MARREPLHALTGMRGVAAVWVVVFHLRPWLGLPGVLDGFARAGYLAVDVFFALSGFVLAYQYRKLAPHPRAWLGFWWRRLARIGPLHLAVTLGLVVVVVARGWWSHPEYSSSGLLAHLTLTQTWSETTTVTWNEPAWSVSAEWHAYLVFPMCAALATQVRRPAVALALALGLVLLPRLGGELDAIAGAPMFVRLFSAFGAGILLARARELGLWLPRWTASASAVALVGAAIAGLDVVVPTFGAMLILALAAGEGRLAAVLARRGAIALGEVSYALYLVHGAAMLLLWKAAPPGSGGLVRFAALAAYVVLVVALTRAGHRWIEVAARRRLVPA